MSQVNTGPKATGFSAWALIFGFFVSLFVHRTFAQGAWLTLLYLAISITLEAFLLFKLAHYLPTTTSRTTEWHEFFYGTKKGSMALLVMCVFWLYDLFIIVALSTIDLVFGGSSRGQAYGKFINALMPFAIFYLMFLLGWIFWTAAKALWRVAGPVERIELGREGENLGFMGRN
ncbi:hypothetical protein G7Z17_g8262 [Cylindrodendrum hubeiense]|uniref:Uncharacterized protein n=1 Tax=Cylindrodendrum hubeiense TaxID=595255 RepID=A0A9P5LEW0_9HYPO|nr:hypothetical protein G7Z17_g8262 [Cylindrodendrum hubeiense]